MRVQVTRQERRLKNSRQVLQTAADPPNHGRMILPIMGCTAKSRNALRKIVQAYTSIAT